jgi:hypothetical protein
MSTFQVMRATINPFYATTGFLCRVQSSMHFHAMYGIHGHYACMHVGLFSITENKNDGFVATKNMTSRRG